LTDGSTISTGGEDGKIKLWSVHSGFCFVTFSEHTSSITGVVYTPNGKVVLSASLDGTVRAFDTTRYRNFRTFTSPRPVQFGCISVDSSGELIAAGGVDVYEVFLWYINHFPHFLTEPLFNLHVMMGQSVLVGKSTLWM
jgi:periodic tryptophan protein 2